MAGFLRNIFNPPKIQPRRRPLNARASYGAAVRIGRSPQKTGIRSQALGTPPLSKRKFDMAVTNDRLFASWSAENQNITWDLRQGLSYLRARSRDAVLNDPYIKKFIKTLIKYVVGPRGFTHVNKAFEYKKDESGEWDIAYDQFANLIIQDAWWLWSKKPYCTITGNLTLRQLCKLIIRTVPTDGEIFLRKVLRPTKENPFGFTLQVIEGAYCDESLNKVLSKDRFITLGIEHDQNRKVTGYYFRKVDPGKEIFYPGVVSKEYVRIDASQIIHIFVQEFPGQLRGIPWITPVGTRTHILKGYEEAHLHAARSAARKVAVIEPKDAEEPELNKDSVGGTEDSDGNIVKNIQPGETFVVPYGYTFKDYDPAFPQGEAGPFTKLILQGISAGLDVDYPTLASDPSGVNFSSAQFAAIDSRIGYADIQEDLIDNFLKPVHTAWLEMAMLSGYIKLPMSKFEKFDYPAFHGFVAPNANHYKDIKGKILANQFNIDSLEEILAAKGVDLFEHLKQLKRERKMIEKAGLAPAAPLKDNSTTGNVESDNAEAKDNADGNERININELLRSDQGEIVDLILEAFENKNGNGKHKKN